MSIQMLLILYLAELEGTMGSWVGRSRHLIYWYLGQHHDHEIKDVQELKTEKKLVHKVLRQFAL